VDNQSPYIAGTEVTVLGQGTLQRTGYTFAGWNTAAGGTGTAYAPGATFPIHADKDLYAQWTPVASTVTFDAGGGSAPVPSSKPVVYGSPYGPLATTLRGGYSLNGWFTAVSGGTVVTQQTLVVAVSDHTLYAQWTLLVPAIPTGMVASVSTGRVDLSWSVSSTTVTSEIRRATSAGGPYETVGTMSGTSFSDTNLSNGGRYFYVIIARNAAGESEATVPIEVQLPVLLPYVEDFESLALAPLDGQSGWQASGVTVQTNIVNTGEKAAQLESEGSIRLEVTGAETNVWTDFFIRPVLFEESPSSIDTNVTTALYFDPDGHPVVYDGPVPVILDHITITNGQWVRITVHSDYATKTWRLYLDNTPVGSERFAFSHTGISGYTDLRVKGAGNADTYLDDVQIMASSPFGEPTTYLLTVISAHGSPVPAAGEHHYPASMLVEASLPVGLFENGSTQHVFKSWVRTGSSPASGTGTNMSFSITENTTIAWLWGTNYWVELRVTGE